MIEDHTLLLSFFLRDVIQRFRTNEILKFETDLLKILYLLIPDQNKVHSLISECGGFCEELERNFGEEELERSNNCLSETRREMLTQAKEVQKKVKEAFEKSRDELLAISDLQIIFADKAKAQVDPLFRELQEFAEESNKVADHFEEVEKKREAEEREARKILSQAEQVIKKAK